MRKLALSCLTNLGVENTEKKYRCLSTQYETSFLIGLIDKYRFSNGERIKRVLEVGIFNGGTGLALLKQGCKNEGFYLYGIDKCETDFYGEAVFKEATKEELEHYELHKGSTTADIENILKDKEKLDMIFIDAVHEQPYPLIDLIYLIPFLRKDALICMHDTGTIQPNFYGPSYVYLYWDGQKYRNYALDDKLEAATEQFMACIVANQGKQQLYKNLSDTANIPYRAVYIKSTDAAGSNCSDTENTIRIKDDYYLLNLNEKDISKLKIFMAKYYDEKLAADVSEGLWGRYEEYQKAWPFYCNQTQFSRTVFDKAIKNGNEITKLWREINSLKTAKENEIKNLKNEISQLQKSAKTERNVWGNKIKYFRYVIASKITFGKMRQKYKAKRELLKEKLYS
jgi:predicted O-methyltransferase YrrM